MSQKKGHYYSCLQLTYTFKTLDKHKKTPTFRTECPGLSQEIKKMREKQDIRFDKKFAFSKRNTLEKWYILQFFRDNFSLFEKDSIPSKVLIDFVETHIEW